MLFNKDNNGSEEISILTGNYYANNDFDKIATDIETATRDVSRIVGKEVIKEAENLYQQSTLENIDLVKLVQRPIAILATLRIMQKNDISHENSGRKVKIDASSEKIPWEWQIENDNKLMLEEHYRAMDLLIEYLEETSNESWINSDQYKNTQKLFIKSAIEFDRYFPIDSSSRMFVLLSPFLREAERRYLKPVLGNDYDRLRLKEDLTEKEIELLDYIKAPLPLLTMAIAIRRMPLAVIPFGVIQNYVGNVTMNSSEAPNIDMIKSVSEWLMDDAMELIEELKKERNSETVIDLLPKNSIKNKYMSVH